MPSPRKLIRRRELKDRIPYSDGHIWRLEKAGEFPQRVQLGKNAVAWFEDEIIAWQNARIRGAGKAVRRPAQSRDEANAEER